MGSFGFSFNLFGYVAFFLGFGLLFIPLGVYYRNLTRNTNDYSTQYDGPGVDSTCAISTSDEGSTCSV